MGATPSSPPSATSSSALSTTSKPSASKPSASKGSKDGPEGAKELASEDVVVVHSRTEDGKGMNVVRKRGDTLSLAVVRPLEEGKPITGDVVTLKPREEHPALFDVQTEVALPSPVRTTPGPSRVANSSYRKGWDSLWGGRRRRKPN